ncbi:hypothetical protein Poli38472_013910 [Pythium oligandrum]|uniref:NodB homology domain-containing protein n=1 Tax=Pythium oligandrum TaxID=41045 RepID=A0A8K1C2G0_PYTOL|nr:hypothetical protein Poli38472_013910 [Pythium oligandrum]|eukprot:TMW55148.1 hypothetical protein Poli38472_013910 [Pythium oligandrum]
METNMRIMLLLLSVHALAVHAQPTVDVVGESVVLPPSPSTLGSLAFLLGLVAFLLAVVYLQPAWLMALVVRHSHPSVLWCVRTSNNVCALTIDDAPSPATPMILDLLKEHGVKATFFIISGNITGNEEVMRRIVREGHLLGNHLTEDRASIMDELHIFEQKIRVCDSAIGSFQTPSSDDTAQEPVEKPEEEEATASTRLLSEGNSTTYEGSSFKWLRPASGWFTSDMRDVILRHGYRICMGSVYPHDAQIKWEAVNSLHLRMCTRPGSVIIVHDRAWTVGVLRSALPKLVDKFRFVSLDELTTHHQKPT